jgi:predicted nucleic acid-binding protein
VIVYVETNFLLELALQQEQHASCEELLRLAESKAITLSIPAFSVLEATQRLRSMKVERGKLQKEVNYQGHEINRTHGFGKEAAFAAVADALVRHVQQAELSLAQLEARLFQVVRFLPLDAAVAAELSKCIEDYKLKPPDATVLASVMKDPQLGQERSCFLNRNTEDFDRLSIVDLLKQRNCTLIGHFDHGLRHVQSVLKGPKQ